jgi:hypothetical protein
VKNLNLNKVVRKTCPITKSDVIVITYPDPEELVLSLRKTTEGKYEKVMKPQKEVKGGLLPRVDCPSQGHSAIDMTSDEGIQLMKEGKAWCRKTKKICPIEQII